MADIRRGVQEVQPNNYVNPGVKSPSPLSLAAAVGSQAIDLDVQLSRQRLAKETEDLRTTYETSSFAAQQVQDEAAGEQKPELTPGDKQQVDSISTSMSANQAAVDQGKMSYDEYRVRGERLLRQAIAKRPGLAQEFRAVAAQHLGVDVVGASIDVLASAERQILAAQAKDKKDDKPTNDFKRMRDQLDAVGVINAHMTDDQVIVAYTQNADAIVQMLQLNAKKDVVKTAAETQTAGQTLHRPQATADFVHQVQVAKQDFYKQFSQGYAAIKSGQMKPGDITTVINNGNVALNGRITELRAAMASGDVNPDIAEKEIMGLQSLGEMMTGLVSGELDNKVLQQRLDGINLYVQNSMLDNDNVAVMSAATKVFGPEIMTTFVQPGGAFNKTAMIALGDTLTNTGKPTVNAQNSGSTATAVITSVLDRGGSKSNPEMIPQMNTTLINAAKAFVEMPAKEFKADYLTGPQGYMTVLYNNRQALDKSLDAADKAELGGAASLAAQSAYQALAVSIGSSYPMLRGKYSFGLDPTTGDFIHPKGKVTPVEAAVIAKYNKAFNGKQFLDVLTTLTDATPQEAVGLFGSSYGAYKEAKDAQKKAKTPATQKSSGDWWSDF